MNCQSFKTQIDEAAFTAELERHLSACSDCKTFREERECLSRLFSKLEYVNAPANFEFGVRAKLNSLPAANGSRVWIRRLVFASPALAAVAVSAFVFTGYNSFSPISQPASVAVQSNNAAPIPDLLPAVSPTQPTLVAANTNPANEMPVSAKQQNLSVPDQSRTVALSNISNKQSNSAVRKQDKEAIVSRNADEPMNSRQEGLRLAPTPLIPPEFKKGVAGKVSAREVLSFYGIEKVSNDGTVESVGLKSVAAEKGIRVGDRIETINGQKFLGADLDNSLRQVTVEVLRNAVKRVVTLETSLPK